MHESDWILCFRENWFSFLLSAFKGSIGSNLYKILWKHHQNWRFFSEWFDSVFDALELMSQQCPLCLARGKWMSYKFYNCCTKNYIHTCIRTYLFILSIILLNCSPIHTEWILFSGKTTILLKSENDFYFSQKKIYLLFTIFPWLEGLYFWSGKYL